MRRINLKYIKVSMYRDVYHQKCSKATHLLSILTSDKYKNQVTEIRQRAKQGLSYKKCKESLPCYTPQGIFKDPLIKKNLLISSHLICMDFDELENFDLEAQKIELSKLPYLAYAGSSCSGTGLFALIAIEKPNRYLEHWQYLYKKFKELGLKPDKSTKNLNRLRFVSYDPNPIINYSPVCFPFHSVAKPKKEKALTPKSPKPRSKTQKNETIEHLEASIRTICSNRIDITQNYNDWVKLGFGLAELGESGRGYFHQLSQFHPEYDFVKTDRQYDDCLSSRSGDVGIGTVLYMIDRG